MVICLMDYLFSRGVGVHCPIACFLVYLCHYWPCVLQEERSSLMTRIQNAGTEVVEAKAGAVRIFAHILLF